MTWLTPEWVQAAAVLLAGIAAWRGFSAWRYELVGRKRYELAEETLALFYQARDVIREMRVGIVDKKELYGGVLKPGVDPEAEKRALAWFDSMDAERLAVFARLEALRFRFMATFGSDYAQAFRVFVSLQVKIRHAARRLQEIDQSRSPQAYEQWDAIRYPLGGKNDEIEREIAEALAPVESVCQNEVKPKSWWDRWREWTKPPGE